MKQPHIEIKTRYLDAGDARSIIEKGTIIGIVTDENYQYFQRI